MKLNLCKCCDNCRNAQSISFFVGGVPATQGSKRAFYSAKIGRAIITEACKRNKPWRSDVRNEAEKAIPQGFQILDCPVWLTLEFFLPRPKGHFGTGNNSTKLRASAPVFHIGKPDAVKLARAVEDALKGVIWKDDSQVVRENIEKHYCSEGNPNPGVRVIISCANCPF